MMCGFGQEHEGEEYQAADPHNAEERGRLDNVDDGLEWAGISALHW
jgi:hypothetical protein